MELIKVALVTDFKNKNIKSVSLFGKKVGIIKKPNGKFYAIEIGCKHQGADLSRGKILNNIVTCPRHGWKYDLETGKCTNRDSSKLRRHELEVDGNDIKVSLSPIE